MLNKCLLLTVAIHLKVCTCFQVLYMDHKVDTTLTIIIPNLQMNILKLMLKFIQLNKVSNLRFLAKFVHGIGCIPRN